MSSWPQWSAAVPPVANPAPPPNVANPANAQYTPEQWQQMQQQNWQQWAQWQQQFQLWQQQYGAEYQKSVNALAVAQTGGVTPAQPLPPAQPPVPLAQPVGAPPPTFQAGGANPFANIGFNSAIPPPPNETVKPPLPPGDPPPPTTTTTTTAPTPTSNTQEMPPFSPANGSYANQPFNAAQTYKNPPNATNFPNHRGNNASWPRPPQYTQPPPDFNNKRPNEGVDQREQKRGKFETVANNWNFPPPPTHQANQSVPNPKPPPQWPNKTNANATAKPNPEELSEAEKKFDKQFADWEAQFRRWKEQNANHPDKEQYKEYEKKWETWRTQLLDRREQMRRKRLGLLTPDRSQLKDEPLEKPLDANATFQRPAPTLNDQPLQFTNNNSSASRIEPEIATDSNDMDTMNHSSFLPSIDSSDGIPGLDLVTGDAETEEKAETATKIVDNLDMIKGKDLEALSKGINNILGDAKLMNMLSMVSQNQNCSNFATVNTSAKVQEHENASNSPLGGGFKAQQENYANMDEHTRSSFGGDSERSDNRNENSRFSGNGRADQFVDVRGPPFDPNRSDQFRGDFDRNQPPPNYAAVDGPFRGNKPREDQDLRRGGPGGYDQDERRLEGFASGPPRPDNFAVDNPRSDNYPRQENYSAGHRQDYPPGARQDYRPGAKQDYPPGARQGNLQSGPRPNFLPDAARMGNFPMGPARPETFPIGPSRNDHFPRGPPRTDNFPTGPHRPPFENEIGLRRSNENVSRDFGQQRDHANRFDMDDRNNTNFGPERDRLGQQNEFNRNFNQFGDNRSGASRFENPREVRDLHPMPPGRQNQLFNENQPLFNRNRNDQFDQSSARPRSSFNETGDLSIEESPSKWTKIDNDTYVANDLPENENTPSSLNRSDGACQDIDEHMWKPEKVIDHAHKTPKPLEPEVLIEPTRRFDYRHKPLNRIPFPQRPKWLMELVKDIPQFCPVIPRTFDPSRSSYPVDHYEARDNHRKYDTNEGFNERDADYESFKNMDERKHYDDRPPPRHDRKYEERLSFRHDDSPRYDRSRYEEKRERRELLDDRPFIGEHRGIKRSDSEFSKSSDKEKDQPLFKCADFDLEKDRFRGGLSKPNVTLIEDVLNPPGRYKRPPRIVIILRGPSGSGKTFLAKLIKDKEVEHGCSAPRILSLDDYFMVEQETEIEEEGKRVKVKEMVYEYEDYMEETYRASLTKAFKKTVTDGYFSFIIVDNVNDKVKYFGEMWSFAKQNGFQVYVCQLELDVQTCAKRNIHGRTEAEIKKVVDGWEKAPPHHPILDATSLIQYGSIPEVEMEEISSPPSDCAEDEDEDEREFLQEQVFKSKWDNIDYSVDNLAKLDGTNKPLRPSHTMEAYLQCDDDWVQTASTKPGQKRVRWADLEERKQQEKMRAIGFVVGQTDWNRMMDPTMGSGALTKTKYIESCRKY